VTKTIPDQLRGRIFEEEISMGGRRSLLSEKGCTLPSGEVVMGVEGAEQPSDDGNCF